MDLCKGVCSKIIVRWKMQYFIINKYQIYEIFFLFSQQYLV